MRKILSLFFALLTVSLVNAKVAFLVPASDTNRESMRLEKVSYIENEQVVYTEDEQSPERLAYDWFKTTFVTPDNGQFICFNDLSDIPSDINAIWIYVDRVGFNRDEFDALFTAERKAQLQAYLNAGGNLFLCKQATRLEKDLVGATNGQSSEAGTGDIIEPDYNDGRYRDAATWGVDYKFFSEDGWGSYQGHRMYAGLVHHNTSYAELIWSNGRKITDNNCGIGVGAMGMGDRFDRDKLAAFQTRNNCRVLGGWANDPNDEQNRCNRVEANEEENQNYGCFDGCHYGGVIEFYPTGVRKGTVITFGLAAYSWIKNNGGWGFDNTQAITRGALDYLNARPCAGDNVTSMEDKFANDASFYPSNTTTFRTLHPVCENLNATYTLTNSPDGIARIVDVQEGGNTVKKLQFKEADKAVTLHITLTENREFMNWPKGTYEYDRVITFNYANPNAAQAHINTYLESDFPGNGVTTENEVQMAMRLHPNVRGLDSVSYVIENHYDNTQGEAYKETKDGVTRLYFSKSGKVLLTINLRENNWVETWPMGDYQFTRVIEFNYTQEAGPTFPWPSQFETGAVGPNSVITLPATVAELPVTYEVTGNASLDGNVLTLANVQSGTVTVNASVTETGVKVTWPMGTYNYENALAFHAAEVGYLLPAAESIDHLKFSDDLDYQGQQPEYNAAKWFEDNYITCANPKGRFVTVDELPTLKAKGIKALWVNIERVNIDKDNGLLTACLTDDGLKTYIQAGGNVLLTKQATRLAYTMGRIDYEPAFNAGEYFEHTNPGDSRSISTRMGTHNEVDEVLDMSGHRLFADMLSWHDAKHVFLVGENCWQTNNYCSWQDFMRKEGEETHYDNKKIRRVQDFEADWNATVFGIQGDISDYCYSNVVEFNAIENEWAGRILTIGATGYQWGSANPTAELDNVKKLTANSLSYLLDEPLADEVYTRNGLTPGIYGTICFDYAVEAGHIEGAEIYELTSFNATNDGVILTQVDAMVAGRPYFFLATANELRLTYHGQRVAAGSYHGLVGHIGETTLHITPNDNNYILYNNELLLVNTDDIELPSYRAYINKYDEIPAYSEPTSNAPRRIMAIEPPLNAPTAVEAVDMQAAQGVYDIMGRKLSAPQGNGFYIINGQKVIITQ